MATKKPKSYDRQPTDTDKSWVAFCQYRDLGTERSLEKMIQGSTKSGLSSLKSWSSKHNWVERCREFDNDELQRQSIALQRERLKKRIAREKSADNYRIALANRAKQMTDQPLGNWSERDIVYLLEASDRFAVISYGGDTPQIPLIQAVETLVKEGILPAHILEIALGEIDNLIETMRSAFSHLE